MRKLALFDIDGTLTQTMGLYDRHWARAVSRVLGTSEISEAWDEYPHATDSGLVAHLFERHHGRSPRRDEIARIQELYMASLEAACTAASEVPGATAFLRRLARGGEWSIAIATGNWERSARWKLERADVSIDGFPLATADDAESREEIMTIAVARAGGDFDRVVYLGDAIWDQRATRRIGMPFIGIGDRAFDGSPSFPDYTDADAIEAALYTAPVP